MKQPLAKQIPHVHSKHGDERHDPYQWMTDRTSDDVLSHLNAENAYRKALMEPVTALEAELAKEMTDRLVPDDATVPVRIGDYWYQTRFESGNEYPQFYRRSGDENGPEQLLLDVQTLAKDKAYCQVSGIFLTEDHAMMAYGVDFVSRRQYDIHFMDLTTGETLSKVIHDSTGSLTWSKDGSYVFYATKDPDTLRVDRIWRDELKGDKPPVCVYHEQDEAFSCGIGKSKSKAFLTISTGATDVSESHVLASDNPTGNFVCFRPREAGVEYGMSHRDDHWLVMSNTHGQKNFALDKVPLNDYSDWTPFIAHREDVQLEGLDLFHEHVVTSERCNGLLSLVIRGLDGAVDHVIDMDEDSYQIGTHGNPMLDTHVLRYGYTSLTTPSTVIDYHMVSHERVVKKQQTIRGGYDASQFTSKRLWATAADGTLVPMSWVGPVNAPADCPTLLYGYGSYGITVDPGFSLSRLSLLERGMAFAIAHVRGGEYLGRDWYDAGKLANKQNTFSDFIACAEHLKSAGIAGDVYAMGGSAGGLLMGAVMNQRPDLWAGIIAAVPFVDVVTTMLDESIPLTTGEYGEWGNPNEAEAYDRMKAYSPYDNVDALAYPPLLVTTGLHDSQVQYWEPMKWVARLRELRSNREPLIMHCDMDTGHGGASGRYAAFAESAMKYAFLIGLMKGKLPLK